MIYSRIIGVVEKKEGFTYEPNRPIIMHGDDKEAFKELGNLAEIEKIRSVRFPSKDFSVLVSSTSTSEISERTFPGVGGMHDWGEKTHPIPDFAIITGINGSGKSQLLKYLDRILCGWKNERVFFLRANDQFSVAVDSSYVLPLYEDKQYDTYINHLKEIYHRKEKKPQVETQSTDANEVDNENNPHTLKTDSFLEKLTSKFQSYLITRNTIEIPNDSEIKIFISNYISTLINKMKISDPKNFFSILFHAYKNKNPNQEGNALSQEKTPWDRVNDIFKYYKFGHRIEMTDEKGPRTQLFEWKIKRVLDGKEVHFDDLPSGEKVIFSVISWQYSFNDKHLSDNKVKIMLLDEPDKHLDPKLCKLFYNVVYEELVVKSNIQVIMSTHRVDTVALSPNESNKKVGIYTIVRTEKDFYIERCHKLRAMFRMTHNLRSLTNFRTKVYVEAPDDARFYGNIYQTLMNYCNEQREKQSFELGPKYQWKALYEAEPQYKNTWHNCFLSRRYQLEFHSTAKQESGGGGGKRNVISSVTRDYYAIESLHAQSNLNNKGLVSPLIEFPFGIIDRDYDNEKDLDDGPIKERIILLKRYALDNYLFDPVVLCSLLTKEEINEVKCPLLMNAMLECKDALVKVPKGAKNLAQKPFDTYFEYFIERFVCSNKVEAKVKSAVHFYIDEITKRLYNMYAKKSLRNFPVFLREIYIQLYNFDTPQGKDNFLNKIKLDAMKRLNARKLSSVAENKTAVENAIGYKELLEKIKKIIRHFNLAKLPEESAALDEIDIGKIDMFAYEAVNIITGVDSIQSIKYPVLLRYMRGHDIDNYVEFNNVKKSKDYILERINALSLCLPLDLVEIFFELNDKVRAQINKIIKPPTLFHNKDDEEGRSLGMTKQQQDEIITFPSINPYLPSNTAGSLENILAEPSNFVIATANVAPTEGATEGNQKLKI